MGLITPRRGDGCAHATYVPYHRAHADQAGRDIGTTRDGTAVYAIQSGTRDITELT
jgi:hypothetical protein